MDALVEQLEIMLDYEGIDPDDIVIDACELSNAVYFTAMDKKFAIVLAEV